MVSATMLSGLPPYGPQATAFPAEWGALRARGLLSSSGLKRVRGWELPAWTWRGSSSLVFTRTRNTLSSSLAVICGWSIPTTAPPSGCSPRLTRHWKWMTPRNRYLARPRPRTAQFRRAYLAHAAPVMGRLRSTQHPRGCEVNSLAWSPIDDQWHPFRVDLRTGKSAGGSYGDEDSEGWQKLSR